MKRTFLMRHPQYSLRVAGAGGASPLAALQLLELPQGSPSSLRLASGARRSGRLGPRVLQVPLPILWVLLAVGPLGCKREAPAVSDKPAASTAEKRAAKARPCTARAISRIVFVDQEKCCGCTRERIDNSWKALIDVVGFPPALDVERVHMDSQADKAAPYLKQQPIMVPPAIYFFDKQDKLMQMLQGEVKVEQLKKVLGTP